MNSRPQRLDAYDPAVFATASGIHRLGARSSGYKCNDLVPTGETADDLSRTCAACGREAPPTGELTP